MPHHMPKAKAMHNKRLQKNLINSEGEKLSQPFEYSKLFLQLHKWWKVPYGLYDFKVALYVCQNHTDNGIYSDHVYLQTLEIPLGPP